MPTSQTRSTRTLPVICLERATPSHPKTLTDDRKLLRPVIRPCQTPVQAREPAAPPGALSLRLETLKPHLTNFYVFGLSCLGYHVWAMSFFPVCLMRREWVPSCMKGKQGGTMAAVKTLPAKTRSKETSARFLRSDQTFQGPSQALLISGVVNVHPPIGRLASLDIPPPWYPHPASG